MPESRKRDGKKAHNKRIQKRRQAMFANYNAVQRLKKQIIEEAKERYEQEQNKPSDGIQFKLDI
jgi:hypothetical protein